MGFFRRSKFRTRKPPARKAASKKSSKISFDKKVELVLNKNLETKLKVSAVCNHVELPGAGLSDVVGVGSAPGLVFNNLFTSLNLTRGSTQEAFAGNQIDNCKLQVRGFIDSLPYHADTNNHLLPYEVHMLVYKRKKNIGTGSTVSNDVLKLKTYPNNTCGGVTYEIMNSLYPWNKDGYIIKKHRVFRMRPRVAEVEGGDADHFQINSQMSNAPMFQRFVQDIPINSKLFIPDHEHLPANEWVGVAFYVINGDGGHCTHGSHPPYWDDRCKVSMDVILKWKDA